MLSVGGLSHRPERRNQPVSPAFHGDLKVCSLYHRLEAQTDRQPLSRHRLQAVRAQRSRYMHLVAQPLPQICDSLAAPRRCCGGPCDGRVRGGNMAERAAPEAWQVGHGYGMMQASSTLLKFGGEATVLEARGGGCCRAAWRVGNRRVLGARYLLAGVWCD